MCFGGQGFLVFVSNKFYLINTTYLASISGALAILNMAPVYYLDGEWCVKPFMVLFETLIGRSFARNSEGEESREFYVKFILRIMSLLFIANVLLSLYKTFIIE